MTDLTRHEIDLLKMLDGQEQDTFTGWGALMGAVMGSMRGRGLIDVDASGLAEMTDKGRRVLEEMADAPQ